MTMLPTTAMLLVNPVARRVRRKFDAARALAYIRRRGLQCRLEIPSSEESLIQEAQRSAERGDDLLFVAGGDGTLRMAAGSIAGSETALAALPGGTANVWCKDARIPLRFRSAIDAHITGQTLSVDLGEADGKPFLLMAGIGWDAAITGTVNHRLKRLAGPAAHGVRGLRMLPSLKPERLEWTDDSGDHAEDCGLMVVSNTRLYGGIVRFSPGASVTDGLLDVCALAPEGLWSGLRLLGRLALAKLADDPWVVSGRTKTVHIATGGIPFQLDGDAIGETPLTLSVRPAALKVRLPSGALPDMFRGA